MQCADNCRLLYHKRKTTCVHASWGEVVVVDGVEQKTGKRGDHTVVARKVVNKHGMTVFHETCDRKECSPEEPCFSCENLNRSATTAAEDLNRSATTAAEEQQTPQAMSDLQRIIQAQLDAKRACLGEPLSSSSSSSSSLPSSSSLSSSSSSLSSSVERGGSIMKKLVFTNVDQWEGHLLPRLHFFDFKDECVVDDNEAARLTLTTD